MTSSNNSNTRTAKGAATKRENYAQRIKAALQELCCEPKRTRLTLQDVCQLAGVSDDPLYKEHHTELRSFVEKSIREWHLARGRRRRPKAPEGDLERRINSLETERDQLRFQLSNALQALNALGQMVETMRDSNAGARIIPLQPTIPNRHRH